jgi:molecular chaperone DnaK (HSP70)
VAAAYCHLSVEAGVRNVLVLDMGAGTTDAAALSAEGDSDQLYEISEARQTLAIGGDVLDRLLLDILVGRARGLKTLEARANLWRSAALSARACKEQLFSEGRAAITHRGRTVTAKVGDITRDREFRFIVEAIRDAYVASLNVLAERAARSNSKAEIHVVLAGGGANLVALQEIVRRARPKQRGVKIRVMAPIPKWAHDARFGGNLAPIFPQLAIAIGGAAAPGTLVTRLDPARAVCVA